MKNAIMLLCILLVFFSFDSCAKNPPEPDHFIEGIEIPKCNPADVIHHAGYSLLYDENYEQARWVAYELTAEETIKSFYRTDKFIVDPEIKTGSATGVDYSGSGYDRGHLAPAADMAWSAITMTESFYYSNMSPQEPGFNRGIWKRLEDLVRTWAVENKAIYVVTGPILEKGLKTIGTDEVAVPKYFYKVILDYTDPSIKGIGFIMPNCSQSGALQNFTVSIDSVESVTGIDFFCKLPDTEESKVEKTCLIDEWQWTSTQYATMTNIKKSNASVQCHGMTKAGNRCKNKTLNVSGYCYLHEYQIKN